MRNNCHLSTRQLLNQPLVLPSDLIQSLFIMIPRNLRQIVISLAKHPLDNNLVCLWLPFLDFFKPVKQSFYFVLAVLVENIFFVIISILHNGKLTYNYFFIISIQILLNWDRHEKILHEGSAQSKTTYMKQFIYSPINYIYNRLTVILELRITTILIILFYLFIFYLSLQSINIFNNISQIFKLNLQIKIIQQIPINRMNSKISPFAFQSSKINGIETTAYQSNFIKHYTVNAQTREEENKIINSLSWRKKTSMPIVKVLNYNSQTVKLQHGEMATRFKVQIQPIIKSITDLRNLDINQAAYLIRQILLGIQTLCIKYNCQFETSKGFYGINDKGQAKVWFSGNFISQSTQSVGRSKSFSVKKVNNVVENIFQILSHTVKHSHKATLEEIGQCIYKQQHTTFAEAQNKFRKLCAQHRILVPNFISLPAERVQNKRTLTSMEKNYRKVGPILKQYGMALGKGMPIKPTQQPPNFSYEASKNASNLNSPTNYASIYQRFQQVPNKPKVNWRYTNSATNQQLVPESTAHPLPNYYVETVNNSINRHSVTNSLNGSTKKQIIFCRSVPIKIDNPKIYSERHKFLGKEPIRDEIVIKQFNPLEQEDRSLQSSRNFEHKIQRNVAQHSNVYTLKSAKTSETKNQDESKMSFEGESFLFENFNAKRSNATTNVSNNTQRGKYSIQQFKEKCYNVNKIEEMIDSTKNVVNSIMIPSPLESRQIPESRTYDFGGLIPINIHKQIEIDGKEAESLEASRDVDVKNNEDVKFQKQSRINFDLLGGIDIMAKFYNTDGKDLKESVWCGEQKKAEHLHIKLEKLGNFGRDICASFVPNE